MESYAWEELRRKAKGLENELDGKLAALSSFGKTTDNRAAKNVSGNQPHFIVSGLDGATTHRDDNSQTYTKMCSDIEQLLEKLTQINDQMTDLVRANEAQLLSGASGTASTSTPGTALLAHSGPGSLPAGQLSQLHTAKRHREILRDYAQEFRQTKAAITASREREDLLGSVYRDLASREASGYSLSAPGSKDSAGSQSSATRLLLDEQEKYHRSNRMMDSHLAAASTIRSALRAQRLALRNATSGLHTLTARFPRIRQLVGKIDWRQRKDTIVLALVIAFCVAFLLIYKLT